jgi:hypothetical protein
VSESKWGVTAPRPTGLVHPVPIDPTGLRGPTRGQAQGGLWRRTSTGRYVPATVKSSVEQRIIEQGVRLRTGAVTGWAALRLWGGGYFDGFDRDGRAPLPVQLAGGRDRLTAGDGVAVSRAGVPEEDVVVRYGVRCLRPEAALFDEMLRTGDLRDAVVAADMAAAAGLVTIAAMRRYARTRRGARGLALVLHALAYAVDDSWSPMETRLRLIWVLDAGWDPPLCNRAVLDTGGRLIGHPDLLDPRHSVLGEYNGADHRGVERRRRDVGREDKFRRVGLECFTVEGRDIDDVPLVLDRMAAARSRAGVLPQLWTVAPTAHQPRVTPLAPWQR